MRPADDAAFEAFVHTHGTALVRIAGTTRLRMRERVELQEEPGHIGVWPDEAAHQEQDRRTRQTDFW